MSDFNNLKTLFLSSQDQIMRFWCTSSAISPKKNQSVNLIDFRYAQTHGVTVVYRSSQSWTYDLEAQNSRIRIYRICICINNQTFGFTSPNFTAFPSAGLSGLLPVRLRSCLAHWSACHSNLTQTQCGGLPFGASGYDLARQLYANGRAFERLRSLLENVRPRMIFNT